MILDNCSIGWYIFHVYEETLRPMTRALQMVRPCVGAGVRSDEHDIHGWNVGVQYH